MTVRTPSHDAPDPVDVGPVSAATDSFTVDLAKAAEPHAADRNAADPDAADPYPADPHPADRGAVTDDLHAADPGGAAATRDDREDYAAAGPLFAELASLPEGDPRRERLRDRLVTMHLAVARHIAAKFRGRGEPGDDLEQVATVGLIHAVDRYDPDRGIAFLAYAVPTMMGEVRRYFRDTAWSIRLPRRLSELHVAIGRASRELSQTLGGAPTPSQLAQHLGVSVAEVQEALEAGQSYRTASLDGLGTDDDSSPALLDRLGEEDPDLEAVEHRAVLAPLLAEIPERERRILMMRFFEHLTQTQIAERVGLSQMHVSRLLARTLDDLRRRMTESPFGA